MSHKNGDVIRLFYLFMSCGLQSVANPGYDHAQASVLHFLATNIRAFVYQYTISQITFSRADGTHQQETRRASSAECLLQQKVVRILRRYTENTALWQSPCIA